MAEYITRKELAQRLKHSEGWIYIWTDRAMQEGIHYTHLNGSRKYLYNWEAVEKLAWSRR